MPDPTRQLQQYCCHRCRVARYRQLLTGAEGGPLTVAHMGIRAGDTARDYSRGSQTPLSISECIYIYLHIVRVFWLHVLPLPSLPLWFFNVCCSCYYDTIVCIFCNQVARGLPLTYINQPPQQQGLWGHSSSDQKP